MKPAFAAVCLLAFAASAAAQTQPAPRTAPIAEPQPGTPLQRQRVIDLAYVLGEAHALHRVCAGNEDNTWRGRMSRLIQLEAPDTPYRARLMSSFNAGFVARSAQFSTCSDRSALAERTVSEKGRDLAHGLASGVSP